jgi:arginase
VLWVDAHPDVIGPKQWQNAHAHVLAILMGEGDPGFIAEVSRSLDPRRILYVGLTETTPYETNFIAAHRIARLSPEELAKVNRPRPLLVANLGCYAGGGPFRCRRARPVTL